MTNILITSAGRRVELIESFKEEGRKLDIGLKIIFNTLKKVLLRKDISIKHWE